MSVPGVSTGGHDRLDVRRERRDDEDSGEMQGWRTPALLRRWAAPVAGSVVAALYLAYVVHFSTNVPLADDWSSVTLVHDALHGDLSWGLLWAQHLEGRVLVPNLIVLAVGYLDHLDIKSIVVLSALIMIAAYFLLLVELRAYIDRRLTAVSTVLLGLVWFSLADTKNALWAFQIAWFVATFCLVALVYLLTVTRIPRSLALALAGLAAVIGSCSMTQGLLLWPVGLLLLLWTTPWKRRTYVEAAIWLVSGAVMTAVFFSGYSFLLAEALCPRANNCTVGFALGHPYSLATFALDLVGGVIPTNSASVGLHELLGIVMVAAAGLVIVQSFRERRHITRIPLPLALVTFALAFDAMIAVGRVGFGQQALSLSQYEMPQVLLLAGVVLYALAHVPERLATWPDSGGSRAVTAGLGALALLLVIQIPTSAVVGTEAARTFSQMAQSTARLTVNVPRVPPAELGCEERILFAGGIVSGRRAILIMTPLLRAAEDDHLSTFAAGAYDQYRAEGPPSVPTCGSSARHGS